MKISDTIDDSDVVHEGPITLKGMAQILERNGFIVLRAADLPHFKQGEERHD